MGRTYKVGPSGSFGARYGTVARKRYATVIAQLRAPHECPQCHIMAVRRLSVGIWICDRCGHQFAGGAYSPTTKLGEIAKRSARPAAAPSLVSKLKAAAEAEPEGKAPTKRRRKKAEAETEGKKLAANPKGSQEPPEDKPA